MKEIIPQKKKISVKLFLLRTFLILLSASLIWLWWSNVSIKNTSYTVTSDKMPKDFEGFCIVQVSDLHNEEKGTDNKGILDLVKKQNPDIIAITGELLDDEEIENCITFLEGAVKIAPCYYVTGNHEGYASAEVYRELEKVMTDLGVEVLHNRSVVIEKDGQKICIGGVDDPNYAFKVGQSNGEALPEIDALFTEEGAYNVLLSHRPDFFEVYASSKADIVFCGHAHGGQVILPFVGGLYAPGQGILPKYEKGVFEKNSTVMIVSTGAGNGTVVPRVNNRPEIVTVSIFPAAHSVRVLH